MRATLFLAFFLLASTFGISSSSAAPESGAGRIPTVTRLVQLFTQLEIKLAESLGKGDKTAVANLLADDFEMRAASVPGNPVPRDAWIRQSLAEPTSSSAIEQMAVHDFGKLAVASFTLRGKTAKTGTARDIFIVDIWTQGPDNWKLTVRYAGPAGTVASPLPGVPMNVPAFEKKE